MVKRTKSQNWALSHVLHNAPDLNGLGYTPGGSVIGFHFYMKRMYMGEFSQKQKME